jgi:hypothetical protein
LSSTTLQLSGKRRNLRHMYQIWHLIPLCFVLIFLRIMLSESKMRSRTCISSHFILIYLCTSRTSQPYIWSSPSKVKNPKGDPLLHFKQKGTWYFVCLTCLQVELGIFEKKRLFPRTTRCMEWQLQWIVQVYKVLVLYA